MNINSEKRLRLLISLVEPTCLTPLQSDLESTKNPVFERLVTSFVDALSSLSCLVPLGERHAAELIFNEWDQNEQLAESSALGVFEEGLRKLVQFTDRSVLMAILMNPDM